MAFTTIFFIRRLTLGLPLCAGDMMNAYASQCGVVYLLENKSSGVQVSSNACNSDSDIALGSRFSLSPGARLWLKSPLESSSGKHFQAICQNRSPETITIGVNDAEAPWISAQGLKTCSSWSDNHMSCYSSTGEPESLIA
jgi:hypothetical protein